MEAPLIKKISFDWDKDEPARFFMDFEYVRISVDEGMARKLAAALTEMADRIERRIAATLQSLEP